MNSAFALDKFWGEAYLGERQIALYAGQNEPYLEKNKTLGQITPLDNKAESTYLWNLVWPEAPEWINFVQDEFSQNGFCSNQDLSKNFDYIRYSYRLLSLSYLLEALDHYDRSLMSLNSKNNCFNLNELLKQCQPKSKDMMDFLSMLKTKPIFEKPHISKDHSFSKFQQEWMKGFNNPQTLSTAQRRILLALDNKRPQALNQALEKLSEACFEDKNLFKTICSEQDHLYGQSDFELMTYLLLRSNIIQAINENHSAGNCIKRFSVFQNSKERTSAPLKLIIASLFDHFKKRDDQFPLEGRAFVWGALREFKDKGLVSLFSPTKEKTQNVVMEPVVAIQPPVPTKPNEVVKAQKSSDVLVKVENKLPVQVEPTKTAFLEASELRFKNNFDLVAIDMLRFKFDYIFSLNEMTLLEDSMKQYVSREAIEEMKEYDHFGKKEGAVPLSFIKYMIDANHHQGLFNLVLVLGDKFWVLNDLDAVKNNVDFIQLKNSTDTLNQWQIAILTPEI